MISEVIHSIVAKPAVYNAVQWLAGLDYTRRRLQPHYAQTAGRVALDVGAGTGLYLSCFPESARYLWLDNDPQKLSGFRARGAARLPAMLGDATRLGLKDKSVDYATCTAVTHHLTDMQLSAFVHELARVVRCKLILQDAVQSNGWISRLLWKYDRGSHPRSAKALLAAIEVRFEIERVEYYSIYHRYLLLVGAPRPH